MSTCIILEDGRIWGCANWQFDRLIESASQAIRGYEHCLPELSDWLLDQRCSVQGPGVGMIDMRRMSPGARQQFRTACEDVFENESKLDGSDWHDPSAFPRWLEHFRFLLRMWKSIDRGDPPEALTDPDWILHPPFYPEELGPGCCCFCGRSIAQSDEEPIEICVQYKDNSAQGLWSHVDRLGNRLHRSVQFLSLADRENVVIELPNQSLQRLR